MVLQVNVLLVITFPTVAPERTHKASLNKWGSRGPSASEDDDTPTHDNRTDQVYPAPPRLVPRNSRRNS